jgi:hypothetical protein
MALLRPAIPAPTIYKILVSIVSRSGCTLFILVQAMRHFDSRKGELCLVAQELRRTEKETVHTIIFRLSIVNSNLREKLRELKYWRLRDYAVSGGPVREV